MMQVGLAADHGGFDLKEKLAADLRKLGYIITDFGARQFTPTDDYPDFVIPLAQAVAAREVDRGVAICGSGVGAAIAANKIPGVRAALITDIYSAHQGVEHDDMNLICLGGLVVGYALARDLVLAFLNACYTGEERHERRLNEIMRLERLTEQQW